MLWPAQALPNRSPITAWGRLVRWYFCSPSRRPFPPWAMAVRVRMIGTLQLDGCRAPGQLACACQGLSVVAVPLPLLGPAPALPVSCWACLRGPVGRRRIGRSGRCPYQGLCNLAALCREPAQTAGPQATAVCVRRAANGGEARRGAARVREHLGDLAALAAAADYHAAPLLPGSLVRLLPRTH